MEGVELEPHSLRECVVQAERKIDLLVGQREELIKDRSPPTMPPFAILDAMIEPYFTTINHNFPIWTKERFNQLAIAMRQSESSEKDLASIICCNNLILMALSANSLCSHRVKSPQIKQAQKISSIDFDVIEGFLTNAKRALNNLDQVVSPRVINVQALLSLFLVAQEFLSVGICETLFTLAVRCAKSIGVHQWHSLQGQISDEDIKERRNISYCLYVLDKTICWTAGSSPNIPISEVQLDSSLMAFGDSIASHLAAKAELAKIEETIYLEVYASQVQVKTAEQVRRIATTILSRLQAWLTDVEINLDEIQKDLEISAPKVELAIRFLCTQPFLIWPYKCHPDATTFQRSPEIAKICMKLLLRLWHSLPDQGNHAFFPLFLASLPPLYLYELLSYILCGRGRNSDIDMLKDFVEMLQTNCRRNVSYNRQLYQMSRIVIDVITTQNTQPQNKRQKSALETPTSGQLRQSDHASLYDSTSDLFSLPITGLGHLHSDVREAEAQGFGSAVFQDPVNSFVFMGASTSANDDVT
ncbi:hypothetical protein EYB25_007242 [Talaromyces marneffei]|nr:hypothetical protein EYB25_007242 [Talaromyces marneffei]